MSSDEIPNTNDLLRAFFTRLHALPEDQAVEGMLTIMNVLVTNLSREQVIALRALLIEKCGEHPEMLTLIDGNLALREIRRQK